jgi:predicted MFS family arabinose efflux permease
LLEISVTFGVDVGIGAQIRTASSVLGVIFAFVMGALSVRFSYKSLLLTGLVIYSLFAVGCFSAPNFIVMLMFFSLSGMAAVMVTSMFHTLIGELLPLEKRVKAMGWLGSGSAITYLFGNFATNYISNLLGWRWSFLVLVLPLSLLCLVLVTVFLPKDSRDLSVGNGLFLEGFKAVFSNRSAVACLVATVFSLAAWSFAIIFGTSFWRQRFLVSKDFISTILVGSASCFILGGLACGRFVNKFGRKDITTLSVLLVGTLIISYANVANLWLSIVLGWTSSFFSGMMFTAANSLKLEQVPKYRGTMMSLNSAAGHFGQTTAGVIGGLVFATYGYNILAIILGILGLFSSLIFHFFTVDPTRT